MAALTGLAVTVAAHTHRAQEITGCCSFRRLSSSRKAGRDTALTWHKMQPPTPARGTALSFQGHQGSWSAQGERCLQRWWATRMQPRVGLWRIRWEWWEAGFGWTPELSAQGAAGWGQHVLLRRGRWAGKQQQDAGSNTTWARTEASQCRWNRMIRSKTQTHTGRRATCGIRFPDDSWPMAIKTAALPSSGKIKLKKSTEKQI